MGRSRSPKDRLFPWIAGKSLITAGICRLLVEMETVECSVPYEGSAEKPYCVWFIAYFVVVL